MVWLKWRTSCVPRNLQVPTMFIGCPQKYKFHTKDNHKVIFLANSNMHWWIHISGYMFLYYTLKNDLVISKSIENICIKRAPWARCKRDWVKLTCTLYPSIPQQYGQMWDLKDNWGLWRQKRVSQAGINNYIPRFTVGCNYVPLLRYLLLVPKSSISCLHCKHSEAFTSVSRVYMHYELTKISSISRQ